MHRILPLIVFILFSSTLLADITTYRFVSKEWKSEMNATICDGKTDGWVCDKAAYEYSEGYKGAQDRIYSRGVSVKTSTSGAGATSIVAFEEVDAIEINFCQNASKGKGSIYVQIGNHAVHELVINRPPKSMGQYNRDTTILLTTPETGQIRFWVNCTENSITINTLTIYNGGSTSGTPTEGGFQLVTDVNQLKDNDEIIIGVHKPGVDYIMGYYDEYKSQNNIHAIHGKYSEDRMQVAANDDAIYTLHRTELDGNIVFYIEDNIRYESAYLVASGGKTKNKLALWDKLYDSGTYGNYGYWNISIAYDGQASIMNLGNSLGKYLQYNASNSPTLFSCYAEQSQTPVAIYRRVEPLGDTMAIIAPMTNFGSVLLHGQPVTSQQTITINGHRLNEDISAHLKHGCSFQLSTNSISKNGGKLTISYQVEEAGNYIDTLVLTSGEIRCEALVLLHVIAPMTISQAVQLDEYDTVYLDSVVVTKKFDSYIFIRDSTGSMLIYDTGDGTGHRYGAGLSNGHVLRKVVGRYSNYYGVPELLPTEAWQVENKTVECLPEELTISIDSADVCRYVRINHVVVNENNLATTSIINEIEVKDAFNTGLIYDVNTTMDAIVMFSWDNLQLWCVRQEVEETNATNTIVVDNHDTRKMIINQQLIIHINTEKYSVLGTRL
jgi:hypothetical protein